MVFYDIFEKKKKVIERMKYKIEIDYREKNCLVPSILHRLGFEIEMKELKVGDYLVNGIIIERKSIQDFCGSIINKRLLRQLEELQQYEKKLLIVEGFENECLYKKNLNENALRGFILSVCLKFKVPIIFTLNSEDTAKYLYVLANKKEKENSISPNKKALNYKERAQYILECFEGIGPKSAKVLLEKFGSLKSIFNASLKEIEEILGKKFKGFEILEKKV
jgi:ERCC4-type nuclease